MYDKIEQLFKEKRTNYLKQIGKRAGSHENAEDVLQNALVSALRWGGSFDPARGKLEVWFGNVLENELKIFKNKERNHGMSTVDEEVLVAIEDPALISKKFAKYVKKNKEHELLELFFLQGYKPPEIAELTGRPVATVYTIIRRFSEKVEERLKNE